MVKIQILTITQRATLLTYSYYQKVMADIQALTKTLVNVVGSLQDLLSKKQNNASLEPEAPRLKKSADMTYS